MRPGRIDRQYKVGYPQKDGRRDTFRLYLEKVRNDLDDEQIDKLAKKYLGRDKYPGLKAGEQRINVFVNVEKVSGMGS